MTDIINNNEKIIYIIKYSRPPSLVKAQKIYQQKNKELVNQIQKKFYNKNKDNEEFKLKKHQYYLNYKEKKMKLLSE